MEQPDCARHPPYRHEGTAAMFANLPEQHSVQDAAARRPIRTDGMLREQSHSSEHASSAVELGHQSISRINLNQSKLDLSSGGL